MHMFKPLIQKLQIWPILVPGRDSWPPGAPLKTTYHLGTSRGIWAIVFQGETDDHLTTHPWEQLIAQGENTAFFNWIFPEFRNPSSHFVLCYKEAGLERKCKMVH